MKKNTLFYCLLTLTSAHLLFHQISYGQENRSSLLLARSYASQGLYERANSAYRTALKEGAYETAIHREYLQFLINTEQYKLAIRYLKKRMKAVPAGLPHLVEAAVISALAGREKKCSAYLEALKDRVLKSPERAAHVVDCLLYYDSVDWAIDIYQTLRKAQADDAAYAYALGEVYRAAQREDLMLREYFISIRSSADHLEEVQAYVEPLLLKTDKKKRVEKALMKALAESPKSRNLLSMLVWFHSASTDFVAAFDWLKISHKRRVATPEDFLSLGQMALSNGFYQEALSIFSFLKDTFSQTHYQEQASFYLLSAHESLLFSQREPSEEDLVQLDATYQAFIEQYKHGQKAFEIGRKRAHLHAFYKDEIGEAKRILHDIVNNPRAKDKVVAQSLLDLGDILIKEKKIWEASLSYFKVEKKYKGSPLAYEAKLKNAKAMYYAGNFCLSLSFFDILKRATFKKIANDAVFWAYFMRSNGLGDCKEPNEAFQRMAHAQQRLLSRDYAAAELLLRELLAEEATHSLQDDACYELVKLYKAQERWEEALALMERLLALCEGVLKEKAILLQAELLEKSGGNREEIERIYFTFVSTYPDSPALPMVRRRLASLQ